MTASQPQFTTIRGYAAKDNKSPLELWEYTPRPLGSNDIEIKIDHCGICGSDIHTIDSGWGPTKYPVIAGHEIVGKVVAKGDGVTKHNVGDLVGVGAQAFACLQSDCAACREGIDTNCPHRVATYNAQYADGQVSQGGYAEAVRVDSNYAFAIPKEIASEEAAPLLCAGATVYTPMLHHQVKAGDRVGVIGIGGLGHLAIQFARALDTHVTAFTTSESKRGDCLKLGAHKVININQEDQLKEATKSLDYLIVATNSCHTDWNLLTSWMRNRGKVILVAAPENGVHIKPFALIKGNISLVGSWIGGITEIQQMFEFCAQHGIRPWIERLPMAEVNAGIQRVRDGKVRYRVVLSN